MTPGMRIKLRALLIKHEGFQNHLYKDTKGKWTIGAGHNIDDLGLPTPILLDVLDLDSDSHIDFLSKYPWFHHLDENRQCALIDLAFNVGDKNFEKFVLMIDALEKMDFEKAADEILHSEIAIHRREDLAHIMRTSEL